MEMDLDGNIPNTHTLTPPPPPPPPQMKNNQASTIGFMRRKGERTGRDLGS